MCSHVQIFTREHGAVSRQYTCAGRAGTSENRIGHGEIHLIHDYVVVLATTRGTLILCA